MSDKKEDWKLHEARVLLARAHHYFASPFATPYHRRLAADIDEWLDKNTPRKNAGDSWRVALFEESKRRAPLVQSND